MAVTIRYKETIARTGEIKHVDAFRRATVPDAEEVIAALHSIVVKHHGVEAVTKHTYQELEYTVKYTNFSLTITEV